MVRAAFWIVLEILIKSGAAASGAQKNSRYFMSAEAAAYQPVKRYLVIGVPDRGDGALLSSQTLCKDYSTAVALARFMFGPGAESGRNVFIYECYKMHIPARILQPQAQRTVPWAPQVLETPAFNYTFPESGGGEHGHSTFRSNPSADWTWNDFAAGSAADLAKEAATS